MIGCFTALARADGIGMQIIASVEAATQPGEMVVMKRAAASSKRGVPGNGKTASPFF